MNELPKSARISSRGAKGLRSGQLVRRTFIIAMVLLSGGFVAGGAIEIALRYQESVNSIWVLQTEMAKAAAFKINQFMREIEKTMRVSTLTREIVDSGLKEDIEIELIKLLKRSPAITTVSALDVSGQELYKISRVRSVQPGDLEFHGNKEIFLRSRGGVSYFSPVYFLSGSEPYASIATPIERFAGEIAGVLIAEVNLKYIWDVVSDIQVGRTGYAYVVSDDGDLIAHPDISLVLAKQNFSDLVQVQSALAGEPGALPELQLPAARNLVCRQNCLPPEAQQPVCNRDPAPAPER